MQSRTIGHIVGRLGGLLCALFLLCWPMVMHAQSTIASWETLTQSPAASPQAPPLPPSVAPVGVGITPTNMIRTGVDFVPTNAAFNSDNWSLGGFNAGKHVSWGMSTDRPYAFTGIDIGVRRSPTGPSSLRLTARRDGGAWTTVDSWTLPNDSVVRRTVPRAALEAAFGTAVFQSSLEFRLHGWNATNVGGTLRITNVGTGVANRGVVVRGEALASLSTAKQVFPVPAASAACGDFGFVPSAALWATTAAIPGSCLEYRITVSNLSIGTATSVAVSDDLSATLFHAFSASGGFAQTSACVPGSPCLFQAASASLAPGASGVLRLRVRVP